MKAIEVSNLRKDFTFKVRNPEKSWVGNFFAPDSKTVTAVGGVDFSVDEGETLAFIGPNGAGKSTTIKMLTGILHPTSGSISVLGMSPQKERQKLALHIGSVFGQRSQLMFNLPLTDSFDLLAKVYAVPKGEYPKRKQQLIDTFDLGSFVTQPVRKLSLGQRMRAEVAASLIHNPRIIFLDEPTIGLDVVAKRNLRETLTKVNKELGTTIFLTSHDAGDIEAVCRRTIVVNHGTIIFDAQTEELKRQYLRKKVITVHHATGDERVEVDTRTEPIAAVLTKLLEKYEVEDISVEDPPLEEVIGALYEHTHDR